MVGFFPFLVTISGLSLVFVFSQGLSGLKRPRLEFDPKRVVPTKLDWCDWKGEKTRLAGPNPSLEMISCDSVLASPAQVLFCDQKTFVAGEIHRHLPQWDWSLEDYPKDQEIFDYISRGVNVSDFFVHFKVVFQGKFYNLPSPLAAIFPKNKVCK